MNSRADFGGAMVVGVEVKLRREQSKVKRPAVRTDGREDARSKRVLSMKP